MKVTRETLSAFVRDILSSMGDLGIQMHNGREWFDLQINLNNEWKKDNNYENLDLYAAPLEEKCKSYILYLINVGHCEIACIVLHLEKRQG